MSELTITPERWRRLGEKIMRAREQQRQEREAHEKLGVKPSEGTAEAKAK